MKKSKIREIRQKNQLRFTLLKMYFYKRISKNNYIFKSNEYYLKYFTHLSYNYTYKQLSQILGYTILKESSFKKYRKLLTNTTKKAKRRKIQLNDYKSLDELKKTYKYYISYDGIKNKKVTWFNSILRFFIVESRTDKVLEEFYLFHQKGYHSETKEYIMNLLELTMKESKYIKEHNFFTFFP